MTGLYDAADKAIREMNRSNLKLFGKLKLAQFDKINLIREVSTVYDTSVKQAKRKYLEIAWEAYCAAMLETGFADRKECRRLARRDCDESWLLAMLEEVDPVTLYSFDTETERKKQRLAEALSAAENRNAEIDRALRYWTGQVAQYADNMVFNARLEAFSAAGVEMVMWHTQEDDRVCKDCEPLDLQIFPIEDVPPPQHYNCRCWLEGIIG